MSAVPGIRQSEASETGKGITRTLARHAATLRFDALPPALVEMTKQCVLDTLGVAIGASTLAPEAGIIADYVRDQGGKPEATLLGFGGKAPAAWAAFAADPEWVKTRTEMQVALQVDSLFMSATDYSPMK